MEPNTQLFICSISKLIIFLRNLEISVHEISALVFNYSQTVPIGKKGCFFNSVLACLFKCETRTFREQLNS